MARYRTGCIYKELQRNLGKGRDTGANSTSRMLVKAPDLHTALRRFDNHMRTTLADFEIAAIIETPILDVFKAKLS